MTPVGDGTRGPSITPTDAPPRSRRVTPRRLGAGIALAVVALTAVLAVSLLAGAGPPAIPASPGSDPILVGAGDIARKPPGRRGLDEETAKILDAMVETYPGRVTVMMLGDGAYDDGTTVEFANYYEPTWGRHKGITRPVPGNHEYHDPAASGYFSYFGAAAGDPGEGYYAYDLGAWRIYALNSHVDHGAGSPQDVWLRQDLAAHRDTACVLAYWHFARFSSGPHGDVEGLDAFWEALTAAGADVVVVAHDHNYQRFAPLLADGTRSDAVGIRQFLVGTGGASLNSFDTIREHTEASSTDTHGVLMLTLHDSSYDFQFVPIAGRTYTDVGTDIACH